MKKHREAHPPLPYVIRLSGLPRVEFADGSFTPWPPTLENKVRVIYAYEQNGVRDAHLKFMLFDDMSDATAVNRTSRLVSLCNGNIETDPYLPNVVRTRAKFGESRSFWDVKNEVDIHKFKYAVDQKEFLPGIFLFDGIFLEGFDDDRTPNFREWVNLERNALEIDLINAVHEATRIYVCKGYYQQAKVFLSLLLPTDIAWHDRLVRKSLITNYWVGDRYQLEQHYQEHLKVIADLKTDIDPDIETLYEATKRRDENVIEEARRRCCEPGPLFTINRYGLP